MSRWKQIFAVLAMAAATALPPGEASAQQAQSRPQAAAPAKPPVVRARDLITPQERQAYRQEMRAARNDPARRAQIRSQMRETLQQRAAARGAVLQERGMNRPGMKAEAARPEQRPAPPPRAP